MKKLFLHLKWPYLPMEHYNLHLNTCKHHQNSRPPFFIFFFFKSDKVPDNNLSLCLAIFLCLLSWRAPPPHHHHHYHHHLCLVSWRFPCLLLPLFVSPKPLMLSVVNGLASRFKAAIAECKFWLLRFIYILVSWSLLYIWVVAMGWHNVNKK